MCYCQAFDVGNSPIKIPSISNSDFYLLIAIQPDSQLGDEFVFVS